jgi:hypothetical protein
MRRRRSCCVWLLAGLTRLRARKPRLQTGRMGGPSRRELGHGNLAERALLPILPPSDDVRPDALPALCALSMEERR